MKSMKSMWFLAAGTITVWVLGAGYTFGADAPATFKVSELNFQRPASWEWIKPSSSMRAAELKVKNSAEGKDPLEVVFFYFGPGNGGGTDANVDRWFKQFKEAKDQLQAKTEAATAGEAKHKVTYVQAEGTYLSGPPLGEKVPKPNYMLQGAIIEHSRGSIFVKLTGPAELAKASAKDFRAMIDSVRP